MNDDWSMDVPLGNDSEMQCHRVQELYPDRTDSLTVQSILGVLYFLVCVCGVGGNLLVIYVALCQRISFTVRTVFIVSLALSDLTTGLTSLPITAVSTIFTREWIFGWLVCHVIGFLQGCSIFASSFTLIAIAVDRYFLIVRPHVAHVTYRRACVAICLFWSTAAVLSLPMIAFMKIVTYADVCGEFCEEHWPNQRGRRIYGVLVLLAQFGLPVACSSTCYVMISNRLGDQIRTRKSQQIMLPDGERRLIQRRKRTNAMMVVMVSTFVFSWLPWNFLNLSRDLRFDSYLLDIENFNLAFACFHLVAMASIVCNPIIYSFYNEPFRKEVRQVIFGGRGNWTREQSNTRTGTTAKTTVRL